MRLGKRVTGLLLAACLAVGMMSTMAFAESTNKTIMLGTSGIGNPTSSDSGWSGSYVYFGKYNGNAVKYRVLDNETTVFSEEVNESKAKTMLLECDTVIESRSFDSSSNVWVNSDIKKYLNSEGDYETTKGNGFLTRSFSALEQAAIAASTKKNAYAGDSDNNSGKDGDGVGYLGWVSLTGEKIFLLDAKEATNTSYGYSTDGSRIKTGGNANWWLRSPDTNFDYYAGYVTSDGYFFNCYVYDEDVGVSPALNINLSSVLFSSAAVGGKDSSGSLSEIGSYTGNEWKLTLKDASRAFVVKEDRVEGKTEGIITLNYTGATFGSNEYVSIILEDSNNNLTHYGRVAQPADTTGSFEFKLPSGLSDGTYTLHVFSEQYNGDCKTDYASAFDNVTLTMKNPTQTTDTTDNSNSNDTSTSTETTTTETVEAAPIIITYTVKKDDYMRKIAREHGITLEQLIALNPQVKNPNLIYAGQVLIVGQTGSTAVTTETTATKTYTVQRGDSLYKIARKNGMTLAELKSLNENLFAQKYIFAGQQVLLK